MIIPIILGIAGFLLAIVAVLVGNYFKSPIIEWWARIPRWAAWFCGLFFVPLMVIAAVEYQTRKPPRSSAQPWGLGFLAMFFGAWIGSAGTSIAVEKMKG